MGPDSKNKIYLHIQTGSNFIKYFVHKTKFHGVEFSPYDVMLVFKAF
jgi:hypothetical protein